MTRLTSVVRELSGLWVQWRVEVIIPRVGVGAPARDRWNRKRKFPHRMLVREHVADCWRERRRVSEHL